MIVWVSELVIENLTRTRASDRFSRSIILKKPGFCPRYAIAPQAKKETGFLWWIIKITVGSKEETRFLATVCDRSSSQKKNRVSFVHNKDNCS
ncbi:hypothetical protein [Planktothricoides sp. SR001]|uniref:hypothetical protein n=1 Tax=Planktothricoides sp. SR001 TaxID=1705388 RepID=UPI0012E27D09|nr:hypothetical protein [Planktothricoides sp. SR001]